MLSMLLLLSCGQEKQRKIKLAAQQTRGLMPDKIATIQVAASKKKSLAVLHFRNNTRDKNLDWLEQGIVEMLVADLSQSRQLNVLSSEKVVEVVQSLGLDMDKVVEPENGLRVARALNAEAFIVGQFELKNDSLHIELELRDGISGLLQAQESVSGAGLENVFTMVDLITRNLRNSLQIQLKETREFDRSIADFMTQSVDAYKYYSLGVEMANKFYFKKARTYFEKAIQLDSTFASAYLRLAIISLATSEQTKAHQLLTKAMQYANQAPIKEKMNIYALEAMTRGDIIKGMELYKQITEMFPEDDEAHLNLGAFYRNFDRVDEAIEQLEATIALNKKNKMAYNLLAYTYARKGRVNLALETIRKYIELAPNEPNPRDSKGEILQNAGRIDEAIKTYQEALKINKDFTISLRHLAQAYLDNGEYKKALKISKKLLKKSTNDREKTWAYILLAFSEIAHNDRDKALEYLTAAENLNTYDPTVIHLLTYVDPDSLSKLRRLHKWLQHEKQTMMPETITFSPFFRLVMLCFYYQYELDTADSLLQYAIHNAPSANIEQIALAFKLILEMYHGEMNPETQQMMSRNTEKYGLVSMVKIPWDFWRFYFDAISLSFQKINLTSNYMMGAIDFARKANNEHFELVYTYAAALLAKLENQPDLSDSLLQSLGAPKEEAWRVCGPFRMTKGFHQAYFPEKMPLEKALRTERDGYRWTGKTDGLMDGYVDLKEITNAGFNSIVYAALPVYSSKAQTVQIRFGPASPAKVWLNDKLVFIRNTKRAATLDDYTFPATLRQGKNYLLVKMTSMVGEIGFYFRITDDKGKGIASVSFGRGAKRYISTATLPQPTF